MLEMAYFGVRRDCAICPSNVLSVTSLTLFLPTINVSNKYLSIDEVNVIRQFCGLNISTHISCSCFVLFIHVIKHFNNTAVCIYLSADTNDFYSLVNLPPEFKSRREESEGCFIFDFAPFILPGVQKCR